MEGKRPEVSVVMAVYNGAQTVTMAIRSLQAQRFSRWELLLVDDASSDRTVSQVMRFGDNRIRIIQNPHNLGLAASLNRGIDMAEGTYIARMDADDISYPDRLGKEHGYLESNRGTDLVGSSALLFNSAGDALGVLRPPAAHSEICRESLNGSFPLYHPTWMGRKQWFVRHRYDPLFRRAQDYELLLRASTRSQYANIQEVLLGYRTDPRALSKRLQTRYFVLLALAKKMRSGGGLLDFGRGVTMTAIKGASDVMFTANRSGTAAKSCLAPADPGEHASWAELWTAIRN